MSKQSKYFFVLYFGDKILQSLLDAMRIIADPKQRNVSHITVKGPYKTVQKELLNRNNKKIEGEKINILGAGNFFRDNQNTVFFKCEDNEELYTIWKSKEERTYQEYHPHITIYDGSNPYFAKKLFTTLNKHNINFSFKVDKLGLYSSKDKTSLFNLNMQTNFQLLSEVAGMPVNQINIDKLSEHERIDLIDRLCSRLEKLISSNVNYNITEPASNQRNTLAEM